MPAHPTPLKFLMPGWFAVVMGLTGLALAWHRAVPAMGETAAGVSLVIAFAAALVFAVLAAPPSSARAAIRRPSARISRTPCAIPSWPRSRSP